jgi:hypothetical protein
VLLPFGYLIAGLLFKCSMIITLDQEQANSVEQRNESEGILAFGYIIWLLEVLFSEGIRRKGKPGD